MSEQQQDKLALEELSEEIELTSEQRKKLIVRGKLKQQCKTNLGDLIRKAQEKKGKK